MNVLNETEIVVRDAPVWIPVSILIFSMITLFFLCAGANKVKEWIGEGIGIIIPLTYVVAALYVFYVLMTSLSVLSERKEVTQYEVTFDEGYMADAKELLSNYKLVGKRGEIYILQSIETEK